jgi:H+/Cl- antiporter ClcA
MRVGAVIGQAVTRLSAEEADLPEAVANGARIATAFNVPLGCVTCSVETMDRRANPNLRITLLTLGVGVTAVAVAQLLAGPLRTLISHWSAFSLSTRGKSHEWIGTRRTQFRFFASWMTKA